MRTRVSPENNTGDTCAMAAVASHATAVNMNSGDGEAATSCDGLLRSQAQ
jgi:hypothetical protein